MSLCRKTSLANAAGLAFLLVLAVLGFEQPWRAAARGAELETTSAARVGARQCELDEFVRGQFEQLRAIATADDLSSQPTAVDPRAPGGAANLAGKLRERLEELQVERSRLLERLTNEHPDVHDLSQQIAGLESRLAALDESLHELPTAEAYFQRMDRLRQALGQWLGDSAAGYERLSGLCHLAQQEARREANTPLAMAPALVPPTNVSPIEEASGETGWPLLAMGWAGAGLLVAGGVVRLIARVKVAPVSRKVAPTPSTPLTTTPRPRQAIHRIDPTEGTGQGQVVVPRRRNSKPAGWKGILGQLLLALIIFLLVAATVNRPEWLGDLPSHPVVAVRDAISDLW